MTIDKMNELIAIWTKQKEEYDRRMEKKIGDMVRERDLALAAQTQKVFSKHHLSPDELNKLKYANKEQLKKLLAFIDNEVNDPKENKRKKEKEAEDRNIEEENYI